jgi:cytochrome P450
MDHLRLRKIVGPVFSPKVADSLRPEMKKVINEIIDEIIDLDSFDLQKDILDKYPAYIIGKIIGVPQDDTEMFGEWADNTFKTFGGNFNADADVVKKTQKDLDKYTNNLITEKRKNPSNDLVSMLVNAEVDDEKLDDIEIACLIQAILIAGIDTTRCQLGLIFVILLSRPDIFDIIKSEDDISEAIEECVRLDGVFKQLIRVASEDIEYNGVLFPKGTVVTPSLVSGQLDDLVFEDATEFKLNRKNTKGNTLSYGGGIHYCLGAALAKAEIQEAAKVIAERMPNMVLSGDVIYKKVYESVWGPRSIPVKKEENFK